MSEPAIQPEWLMRLKPKTYIVHYYPSSHAAVISHRNRGRAGRQILNRHLGLSSDCFRSSDETGNRSTLNKNLSLYYKKRKLTGLPATSRNQYTINLSEFRQFSPSFFPDQLLPDADSKFPNRVLYPSAITAAPSNGASPARPVRIIFGKSR